MKSLNEKWKVTKKGISFKLFCRALHWIPLNFDGTTKFAALRSNFFFFSLIFAKTKGLQVTYPISYDDKVE
jgi:hypothetical protein